MDKLARLKKLYSMGMSAPQPSLALDQKEDVMGGDISPELLQRFAADKMYEDRGYEDMKRVQDADGSGSMQGTKISPEELERKKLALQKLMGI
tara:strand:+ start:560 stop:838 length:279 start_codon:yes stop_codon:yes gene_type:complete